jgi:hypothetical protein
MGLKILDRTLQIIEAIKPKYWIIENPRGMMRKFMPHKPRNTVSYCQYGDSRMKPTDLFNNLGFVFKPICKPRASCHISAPRGSKTGTQGLKGAINRGVVPKQLCEDIIKHIEFMTEDYPHD